MAKLLSFKHIDKKEILACGIKKKNDRTVVIFELAGGGLLTSEPEKKSLEYEKKFIKEFENICKKYGFKK